MGYTDDPEVLAQKLQEAGLQDVTDQMRGGYLTKAVVITAPTTTIKERFRFLIYSFLRLTGLTKTYRLKWDSPTSFKIVPDQMKASIRQALTAIQEEREIPAGYIGSDMSFLTMDDDDLIKSALKGDDDDETPL